MPGLYTGMEVANANSTTHLSSANQPHDDSTASHSAVKNEANDDDIFGVSDNESDGEGGYKPRPQLPQPHVNMRSLASLINELESGVIDVDPEYQRAVVWTAERMTGLVDSLMENYYIPPIILNKKRNVGMDASAPRDTLVCVDGKQRLSSIRAFVKGMIPCHDHKEEKWWFCKTPGTTHKRFLPLETQKLFLEKDFVAFQFTELTPEQEEDLFARVQMGLQLTVAEKMRAKQGPWQELAKLFVEDFPTVYNLMKDRARAKDFQLTLACFSQILEVKQSTAANSVPILKTNHSALPKLLSNTGAVDDAVKSHLASVWTTFRELIEQDPDTFTNAGKYLSGVQTFAPVEMVAVTVLISMYSETRHNELLLGDVRTLREALRQHFKDLRLHTPVWKFVWNFIKNLEAIRGAVDSTTVNRNQLDQASNATPYGATAIATVSSPPTVSRKRAASTKKPLPILLSRNSVNGKNEPQQSIPVLKRQRTDYESLNIQAPASSPVHGNVNNPHITDARIALSGRMRPAPVTTKHPIIGNMFAQYGLQQQSPNNSTSASPQASKVLNQLPRMRSILTTSAPLQHNFQGLGSAPGYYVSPYNSPTKKAASTYLHPPQESVPLVPDLSKVPPQPYHHSLLPPTHLHNPQQPKGYKLYKPGSTPPQIQQTGVSGPSNCYAPIAPMQLLTQLYPPSWLVPITNENSHNSSTVLSRPPNMIQAHPTSRGAFAPNHTDEQWQGIVASVSPQLSSRAPPLTKSVASSATSAAVPQILARAAPQARPITLPVPAPSATPATIRVAPQPSNRKHDSITRPSPAQYEGAIDLTSEDELEEERQNRLCSYTAKPTPAKQLSAPATPTTKSFTAPTRRDPVVIHDIDSDEDSAVVNNPYERFKNNPRAGLSGLRH